ncbi:phosphate ABC transporter permease PstA [Cellulosilyticum sp. I15G10I2]|uniref:phosphate ABC transporter permease PstA n=1 Tax=Cellulosilyticum sp. I15G10I2 TaxID=1892843 RepID=UPI00085CD996|nr:phosphate ABC transporter permease PstA [Cellulosilyticum sp. I15G10I2]
MKRYLIQNNIYKVLCWMCALIAIAGCFGIIIYIGIEGLEKMNLNFLVTEPNPTFHKEAAGGISTPIIGTLILTVMGTLIAFPWGLLTAVYLTQYAKRGVMANFFKLAIEVLSGVPTIVIAIFGLAIFSNPFFAFLSSKVDHVEGIQKAFGRSFLVASITMAVMILPYVTKTCIEAVSAVSNAYIEASYAMGASKRYTIIKVLLPAAQKGIVTAIILGMGRIIGDTAIVWLTLGGTLRMTGVQPWYGVKNWWSTLTSTGSTLTSYIYYTSPAGEGNMPEVAFSASLFLIIIIISLNFIVDLIGKSQALEGEDK